MTGKDNNPQETKFELPPYTPPDWTISETYERSWQIVKKFKVLWIFGMAAAGIGSSFSLDRLSNLDSKKFQGIDKYFNTTPSHDAPDKISQVLGATSSNPDFYKNLLSLIPTSFYVLLGLEVLLLIITGIVITLITNSWSTASLLQAIQTALNGDKPTIEGSSEKAFPSIKPLTWLFFVPTLVFVLISIFVFGILGAGIAFSGNLSFIFIILTVVASLFWLYAAIMLTLSQIWAPRKVVFDKAPAFQSLKDGFEISKNKFWSMVLLGLVNTIMSVIVIGIPVAIIAGFIFGGVASFDNSSATGIALLIIGGILLLIFLLGFSLVGGILTAFKASVWTIAYNKIRGKYDTK